MILISAIICRKGADYITMMLIKNNINIQSVSANIFIFVINNTITGYTFGA